MLFNDTVSTAVVAYCRLIANDEMEVCRTTALWPFYCLVSYLFVAYLTTLSDNAASNDSIINGQLIGKDAEGSGGSLFSVLRRYLLGHTDENHTLLQSGKPVSMLRFETRKF